MTCKLLLTFVSIALSLFMGFATQTKKAEGKRYVVIAGVKLSFDNLRYTLSDARLIERVLGGEGSDVVMLLSDSSNHLKPTREVILQSIRNQVAKAGPNDTVWFYYSGHGTQWNSDKKSYLVPQDARPGDKDSLISVSELRAEIKKTSKARANIFILDTCYAGSTKSYSPARVENMFGNVKGVATLAASTVDQEAHEFPEIKHSVFTFFLARGLAGAATEDNKPIVSLRQLEKYVSSCISQFVDRFYPAHSFAQTPVFMFTEEQQDEPLMVANDQILETIPEPSPNTPVIATTPLNPGVLVLFECNIAKVGEQTESLIRSLLIKDLYPVITREQVSSFIKVLQNSDTVEAGEQAARMNARFLLRGKVETRVRNQQIGKQTIKAVECTVTIQVVDSYGRVLVEATSDTEKGVPVIKTAFTEDRAMSLALSEAVNKVYQKIATSLAEDLKSLRKES